MNGQHNGPGIPGYMLTPQQQALLQQQQYTRMLNQQAGAQQAGVQQQIYDQSFYPQGYMQSVQQIPGPSMHVNTQVSQGLNLNPVASRSTDVYSQLVTQQQQQQQQYYGATQQQQYSNQALQHHQTHQMQPQYQSVAVGQYQAQNIVQSPPHNVQSVVHMRQQQQQQASYGQQQVQVPASREAMTNQHYYEQQQQPVRPNQNAGGYRPYEQQQTVVHPQVHAVQQPAAVVAQHQYVQPGPSAATNTVQRQQSVNRQSTTPQAAPVRQPKASPAKETENAIAHNEMIRKMRLEEEAKKQQERDKRDTARIQGEMQTKEQQANRYAKDVQDRLDQIDFSLTLAASHISTNLTKILPLPQDPPQNPQCLDEPIATQLLNGEVDDDLIQYMAHLLSQSFEDVRQINPKHNEIEANIYEGDNLPPLMKAVHNHNQYSFHIQSEFDEMTLDPELAKAVAEVAAGEVGDLLQLAAEVDPMPSTSNVDQRSHSTLASTSQARAVAQMPTPKGKGSQNLPRRKRDMVGELVDSLSANYYVSGERNARRRTKTGDDASSDDENHPQEGQIENGEAGAQPRFFQKAKRSKKKSDSEPERPPTPTEVIHQRDIEWAERQRNRQDKLRRRQEQAVAQGWTHDATAEGASQTRVEGLMRQIFEQIGIDVKDNEASINDFLIELPDLEILHNEVSKLKTWRKLHKVDSDQLGKLVQILEKNIRNVIDEEGLLVGREILENDDVGNEAAREFFRERLVRAAYAASTALIVMTSYRVPKAVISEDTIERAAQLCKQLLAHVIYPAADTVVRNSKGKKGDEGKARRRQRGGDMFVPWVHEIYIRIVDMISCFSDFIRIHTMNDVVVVQLSTMANAPFFVDSIGEIHMASIQLLSIIFRKYEDLRAGIIHELLMSVHNIPSNKNPKNCYRLSNNEYIHNFTVLLLQLVQSVVVIPPIKRNAEGEKEPVTEEDDSLIVASVNEAKKWAGVFLNRFLHRCTAKAEEDYRRRFETFLHDLLSALYRPDWPAAELMLTVLGNLLVQSFRNKTLELSLRTASLDYLGTITARLRKDVIQAENKNMDKSRFDTVIRGILYDELGDPTKLLEDIDTTSLSSTEKIQKLQQALIDYLVATKSDNDVSAEYAISFYTGEWYKNTLESVAQCREDFKTMSNSEDADSRDIRKEEKRLKKIIDRSESMKEFLIVLADTRSLKKRSQYVAKTGIYLIDSDALWTVKYLAMKREFSQSFDSYLRVIVFGVQFETSVGLRTKAMRCLTGIIEADASVLTMPDVTAAVHSRMVDTNAAVREATLELMGKYIVSRPDLFDNYYTILNDRILDTGVSVRKRVIRIFRDYIEKMPTSEKVPAMISKIMKRVSDSEEGVRKLALEMLTSYFFVPLPDRDVEMIENRVQTFVDSVNFIIKDGKSEIVETFMTTVLKKDGLERSVLVAAQQNADTMLTYILKLEKVCASKLNAEGITPEQKVEIEKPFQERRLAALSILFIMTKVRPELVVHHVDMLMPYLTLPVLTPTDKQVLNHVINIMGRIVPLIDHPSDHFLKTIDERMCAIIKDQGMMLIESAIACLGTVLKRWPRIESNISHRALQYIGYLARIKTEMSNAKDEKDKWIVPAARMPTVRRSLFSIGPLCRFVDFDEFDKKERSSSPKSEDDPNGEKKAGQTVQAVYSLLAFYSKAKNADVSPRAIGAIGHICSEYPEFFNRQELRDMYELLLQSNDPAHLAQKSQVLRNLNLFLKVEEERILKASEEYRKMRAEQGEIEGDELGVTDTRGSTRSAVIQLFWKHILTCYINTNDDVRSAVSLVVHQTMHQGLVTPGEPLPTMVAMTSDPKANIRLPMELLLKETDAKFGGMLASKATRGVRQAFALHKCLVSADAQKHVMVRGFRATEHCTAKSLDGNGLPKQSVDAVPLLNALYNCLRTNRQQRRSFLSGVVRMFS
uniref:Nipped-B protein n=1 Tax=Panagrellus redivivus TaxID=6233 RepID=A0A7E4ZYF2_PANRE